MIQPKIVIMPIGILADVKAYMMELEQKYTLNAFQRRIIHERYVYHVEGDDAKSLVIAAWPLQPALYEFHHNGKVITTLLDDNYAAPSDEESRLAQSFADRGHSLRAVSWLPLRHLAVRGGLAEYGRNNIAYCDEWGSFAWLGGYVSDMPPPDDYIWRDVINMPVCESCDECVNACKTAAITPAQWLIDNEKCFAYHIGYDNLPDWIPSQAYRYLQGCYACQAVCPANSKRVQGLVPIVFDEAQTQIMLDAATFADYPQEIKDKLAQFDATKDFAFMPRNLRLLLENAPD